MNHSRNYILLLMLAASFTCCKKNTVQVKSVVKIESNTTSRLNKVQFTTNNTCIVAGGERFYKAEVLRSTDGGSTWNLTSHPDAGKGMYGLDISPSGTIYLGGFDGKLLVSNDNGEHWATHQVPYWKFLVGLAFTNNNECVLISTDAQNYGTILRIDSAYNILDTMYYKFGLNDIAMPSANTGYITGYGAVLKTTDGGKSWNYLDVKNDNFISLHCLNDNEIWVCGYRGSIFHTKDGGINWDKLRNGNNLAKKQYSLLGIYFKDADNGWACGEKGLLIKTTDGGKTWSEYENFTDNALRDIALAPDGNLIVAGDNGSLYKLYIQ